MQPDSKRKLSTTTDFYMIFPEMHLEEIEKWDENTAMDKLYITPIRHPRKMSTKPKPTQ